MNPEASPVFLVVCLNPVIQKTLVFRGLEKGEVNRSSDHRVDAAGKGVDCARILGQIGRKAVHLTHAGGPTRDWFLSLCRSDGLDLRWVESGSEIRFCSTVLDLGDESATELVEEARPVNPQTAARLEAEFIRLLPEASAVLLTGSSAAGYPEDILTRLARESAACGRRLYLDIRGKALLDCLPARPVAAKPNIEELAATFGMDRREVRADDAARDLVRRAGRKFFERSGTSLVVTRGALSVLYWDKDGLREAPVRPVKAANPIGSGDAFFAGMVSALEDGADLSGAVGEGVRLGALNAGTMRPGSLA